MTRVCNIRLIAMCPERLAVRSFSFWRRLDGGERKEVFCGFYWVGPEATNNEAEYEALIEGLRAAKELGIRVNTIVTTIHPCSSCFVAMPVH